MTRWLLLVHLINPATDQQRLLELPFETRAGCERAMADLAPRRGEAFGTLGTLLNAICEPQAARART